MDNTLIEIIKLISSIATPIIVLIFGILITQKIEYIKNEASKKKEWQTKWSENFFHIFQDFNLLVEDFLCSLFLLSELIKNKETNSSEVDQLIGQITRIKDQFLRKNYAIRTQLCFSPQNSSEMIHLLDNLYDQISKVLKSKMGNIYEIQNTLAALNLQAKIVHSEILNLS
jgi:hypothetical protein